MARDGNGVFITPNDDFVSGTSILSSEVDENFADIATEITNSIPRDGQAAPTANIPFGGYKITGLGNGSSDTDSITYGQVRTGTITLTNKTIDLASNTLTMTTAQLNTALSDNDVATLAGSETLTNKTITSPTISSPTITGTASVVTQSAGNNSTAPASTAYVDRGASGASLVLISAQTASSSSAIDFTSIPSTYDEYILVGTQVVPATNAVDIWLRLSDNNGSSYGATNYTYQGKINYSNVTSTDVGSATAVAIPLMATSISSSSGARSCFYVRLFGLGIGSGAKSAQIHSNFDSTGGAGYGNYNGSSFYLGSTAAINAIRVIAQSGNISSGNIALYGVRKA